MPSDFNLYGCVLVTRPINQAHCFVNAVCLRTEGHPVQDDFLCLPVMDIEPCLFQPLRASLFEGLIFSSANGVRHFMSGLPERLRETFFKLRIYVVGEATAQIAQEVGFKDLGFIASDGAALCSYLNGSHFSDSKHSLLFVRGEDVHTDFEQILDSGKFKVMSLIVYRARGVTWSANQVQQIENAGKIGGVTFFSERSAAFFIENLKTCPELLNLKKTDALCISKSVLEAVRPFWEGGLYAATSPDKDGMAGLVIDRVRG